jgi:hypothetical protein
VTPRASPFSISSTSSTATVAPRIPYTSAISRPSPLAPPVMTMSSSLRSTSRGRPNASLLLMAPKIQDSEMNDAQAIETSMGGASQNMFWARKQSGTIHAMKGWKKLVLRTLRMRSMESGANQESRWGAVAYGGGIASDGCQARGLNFEAVRCDDGDGDAARTRMPSDYQIIETNWV